MTTTLRNHAGQVATVAVTELARSFRVVVTVRGVVRKSMPGKLIETVVPFNDAVDALEAAGWWVAA